MPVSPKLSKLGSFGFREEDASIYDCSQKGIQLGVRRLPGFHVEFHGVFVRVGQVGRAQAFGRFPPWSNVRGI